MSPMQPKLKLMPLRKIQTRNIAATIAIADLILNHDFSLKWPQS
jgi:hypothetical protein